MRTLRCFLNNKLGNIHRVGLSALFDVGYGRLYRKLYQFDYFINGFYAERMMISEAFGSRDKRYRRQIECCVRKPLPLNAVWIEFRYNSN